MIYIEPDRTAYPDNLQAETALGIESLTGADMIITDCPLPFMEVTLQDHIQARALFVQIKIGYDVLSFDGLKSSIARMQQSKIPMPQCVLLFIGRDWQGDDDLFRIENNKPFGDTTYKTFLKLKRKWIARGGVIDWLNNIEQLPLWIEAQQEVTEDVEKEGKRELYPKYLPPMFEIDDIWQLVEEVNPNTWEHFFCAGLKGFGQASVQNVRGYIENELSHMLPGSGLTVLKVLTDEDENGKPVHDVKGWGETKRKTLRDILGLFPGANLELKCNEVEYPYKSGWESSLRTLKQLIDDGHSVKDAYNAVVKMSKDVIEF